ncbi:MAG: histidine kinase N-terminal 7TM domain-containing protein, partial [Anaerolineales bacterium]
MASPIITITAIASLLGFISNSTILYLVLSQRKKLYHLLFAGLALTCAIWDLGIFLAMIRNSHPGELIVYGYIATTPASFILAFVHHFSVSYTGMRVRWSVILIWGISIVMILLTGLGYYGRLEGIYQYSWGNIFKVVQSPVVNPLIFVVWFAVMLSSVWILLRGRRSSTEPLERRHFNYIIAGFLAITTAVVKVVIVMGIDIPFVLPLGMILNDTFAALIGIAIVKDRLLDITVIIKKGALYSALAGLVVFVFSFSEHIFAT